MDGGFAGDNLFRFPFNLLHQTLYLLDDLILYKYFPTPLALICWNIFDDQKKFFAADAIAASPFS